MLIGLIEKRLKEKAKGERFELRVSGRMFVEFIGFIELIGFIN